MPNPLCGTLEGAQWSVEITGLFSAVFGETIKVIFDTLTSVDLRVHHKRCEPEDHLQGLYTTRSLHFFLVYFHDKAIVDVVQLVTLLVQF